MIRIEDLTVVDVLGRPVVQGVSLHVEAGELVAVVGESGAGKTTLALTMVGAVRRGLRVAGGSALVNGADALRLAGSQLRRLRRTVAYLHQDPASALTPTIRVRGQLTELATDRSPARVSARLADVGLPSDAAFQRRYPHQLSGGQRQRLALARATSGDPLALILDKPTTGLDDRVRDLVLAQIKEVVRRRGQTLVVITHDLLAAAKLCDRVVVMRDGSLVEDGPISTVLTAPASAYARDLVEAVPKLEEAWQRPEKASTQAPSRSVLQVTDLSAGYRERRRYQEVFSGITFDIRAGECFALLGASGSGKTTIARCLSGTHRRATGTVELSGLLLAPDIRSRTVDQRRRVQVVPQHSAGSLNPRRTIGASIMRPLRLLRGLTGDAAVTETARLLAAVHLPATLLDRYPSQLSGGQRQRIAIARALAAEPDLLICDEATADLDVRVQASILELLDELRSQRSLAMLLIAHDLGVVARCADRVALLEEGRIVEQGPASVVLRRLADDTLSTLPVSTTSPP